MTAIPTTIYALRTKVPYMKSFLIQSHVLRNVVKDPEQRKELFFEKEFKTKNLGRLISLADDNETDLPIPRSFTDLADPNADQSGIPSIYDVLGSVGSKK
eukprot:gene197-4443_t